MKLIQGKQEKALWDSSFLDKLSKNLSEEFPDMKGFSIRNLKYIRQRYNSRHFFQLGNGPLQKLKWSFFQYLGSKISK